jgi:hypothetical protein
VWAHDKDQARNGRCLIDRLVKLGWLAGVARNDKAAVLIQRGARTVVIAS